METSSTSSRKRSRIKVKRNHVHHALALSIVLSPFACGTDTEPTASPDAASGALEALSEYAPCAEAAVGAFEITLHADYTSVQGQVADGVEPAAVFERSAEAGGCVLLTPKTLFCEAGCASGTTCGEGGTCVPYPSKLSVGTVKVTGLKTGVEMTASAPTWFYLNKGTLPHPAYDPGAAILLEAAGDATEALSLRGFGVEALSTTQTSAALDRGKALSLAWDPPADAGPARVFVKLEIATHGGSPGRVECHALDTGALDVPSELVDALLDRGYSGFPSVGLTRRSADSVNTSLGCVELVVRSSAVLDVEIEGLISCSSQEDCPDDQVCREDLSCGPIQ
jgi:hypothetical protein